MSKILTPLNSGLQFLKFKMRIKDKSFERSHHYLFNDMIPSFLQNLHNKIRSSDCKFSFIQQTLTC